MYIITTACVSETVQHSINYSYVTVPWNQQVLFCYSCVIVMATLESTQIRVLVDSVQDRDGDEPHNEQDIREEQTLLGTTQRRTVLEARRSCMKSKLSFQSYAGIHLYLTQLDTSLNMDWCQLLLLIFFHTMNTRLKFMHQEFLAFSLFSISSTLWLDVWLT